MKTILIIEDNPSHLKLASELLERSGYTVLQAEDGERGLALARTRRPDLVLTDIALPGMDGIAVIRVLKADAVTRDIPVIAVTAYLDEHPAAEALAAGAIALIAKPYHYKDLLAAVAAALPG